jgi:ferric-dicitrate binding protein FerR (iron transport regulator)
VATDKTDTVRISDEMSVFEDKVVYSADERPKEDDAVRINTLSVGRGKRYMATLSDGTKVWLNSGSTLTYPVSFDSDTRRVTMTGECFFDVAKDPNKPFIVETRGMEVEAIGTSFNMTCYENEEIASMTLSTGRVIVGTVAGSLTVEAGRRVEFDRTTVRLFESVVDTEDYSSWIDGQYKFTGATFGYVIAKLELWYNVTIIDRSNIGDSILFRGAFDDMDIESAIKSLTINTSTTYDYDAEKNIFTINP